MPHHSTKKSRRRRLAHVAMLQRHRNDAWKKRKQHVRDSRWNATKLKNYREEPNPQITPQSIDHMINSPIYDPHVGNMIADISEPREPCITMSDSLHNMNVYSDVSCRKELYDLLMTILVNDNVRFLTAGGGVITSYRLVIDEINSMYIMPQQRKHKLRVFHKPDDVKLENNNALVVQLGDLRKKYYTYDAVKSKLHSVLKYFNARSSMVLGVTLKFHRVKSRRGNTAAITRYTNNYTTRVGYGTTYHPGIFVLPKGRHISNGIIPASYENIGGGNIIIQIHIVNKLR